MLPLGILEAARGKPMMVELKNGETYNGHLHGCDHFMNLTLNEVFETSADGTHFWKMPEVYIKGQNVRVSALPNEVFPPELHQQIKYIRVPDAIIDQVKEQEQELRARGGTRGGAPARGGGDRGRGGRGAGRGVSDGRGRGGPPRGGARGRPA